MRLARWKRRTVAAPLTAGSLNAMRWSYVGATFLLLVSLAAIRSQLSTLAYSTVEIEAGVPALVLAPEATEDQARGVPSIVLLHDLGGDTASLRTLAGRLAGAGYGVVVPQLRGHQANRHPLAARTFEQVSKNWQQDVEAAVLYARSRAGFDPDAVAIGGYGAGATAALEYASSDPSVAATVAISGVGPRVGPYPPPNVLAIWASGDSSELREQIRRAGAERANLKQVVVDRVYGELERGTGLKLTEVGALGSTSLLHAAETGTRVLDWLQRILPARGDSEGEDRAPTYLMAWTFTALVALVWLLVGLARALPGRPAAGEPAVESAGNSVATSCAGVALAAALGCLALSLHTAAGGGWIDFLPLQGARDVVGAWLIAGVALHGCRALRETRSSPLVEPAEELGSSSLMGIWNGTETGSALLLFLPILTIGGVVLEPWVTTALPTHRLLPAVTAAILLLPLFTALECELRRGPPVRALAVSALSRVLLLGALATSCAVGLFELPASDLVWRCAAIFIAFELLAYAVQHKGQRPWTFALTQSLWLGWMFAAVAPVTYL